MVRKKKETKWANMLTKSRTDEDVDTEEETDDDDKEEEEDEAGKEEHNGADEQTQRDGSDLIVRTRRRPG